MPDELIAEYRYIIEQQRKLIEVLIAERQAQSPMPPVYPVTSPSIPPTQWPWQQPPAFCQVKDHTIGGCNAG
jgi:hypothetical protein